ncbi:MAG: helix-turn-helix transcriptional regulator [Blastocatellia bacterium]
MTNTATQLWLSVDQAAPLIGDKPDAIYRDIRAGQFPFRFVRIGKRIKICARSIGLTATTAGPGVEQQKDGGETESTTTNQ